MSAPLGIATYLTAALPESLKGSLPEIADLEATLAEIETPDVLGDAG